MTKKDEITSSDYDESQISIPHVISQLTTAVTVTDNEDNVIHRSDSVLSGVTNVPPRRPDISLRCPDCREFVEVGLICEHRSFHRALTALRFSVDELPQTLEPLLERRGTILKEVMLVEDPTSKRQQIADVDNAFEFLRAEVEGTYARDRRLRERTHVHDAHGRGLSLGVQCVVAVGVCSVANVRWKARMEDTYVLRDAFGGDGRKCFVAVYDGHNGARAALTAAHQLHHAVLHEMAKFDPRTRPGPQTGRDSEADIAIRVEACDTPRDDVAVYNIIVEEDAGTGGALSETQAMPAAMPGDVVVSNDIVEEDDGTNETLPGTMPDCMRFKSASCGLIEHIIAMCEENLRKLGPGASDPLYRQVHRRRQAHEACLAKAMAEVDNDSMADNATVSAASTDSLAKTKRRRSERDPFDAKMAVALDRAHKYTDMVLAAGRDESSRVRWSGCSTVCCVVRDTPDSNVSDVNVSTSAGDVRVSTDNGGVPASTETGDVPASTAVGDVRVSTDTGDVPASTGAGDVRVSTVTGDVPRSTDTGDVRVSTDTGDARFSTDTGDFRVSTDTADVTVSPDTGVVRISMETGDVPMSTNTSDVPASTDTSDVTGDLLASTDAANINASPDAGDAAVSTNAGDRRVEFSLNEGTDRRRISNSDLVNRKGAAKTTAHRSVTDTQPDVAVRSENSGTDLDSQTDRSDGSHNGSDADRVREATTAVHSNAVATLSSSGDGKSGDGTEEEVVDTKHAKKFEPLRQLGVINLANAGHIHAVLIRGNRAHQLSKDHTLRNPKERKRILREGGHFCDSDKELRVNAVLEATRGLGNHGDPLLKACVITDPYTTSVKIDQHAQMLVLASRGVWEMFSPEEVMTILVQMLPCNEVPRPSSYASEPHLAAENCREDASLCSAVPTDARTLQQMAARQKAFSLPFVGAADRIQMAALPPGKSSPALFASQKTAETAPPLVTVAEVSESAVGWPAGRRISDGLRAQAGSVSSGGWGATVRDGWQASDRDGWKTVDSELPASSAADLPGSRASEEEEPATPAEAARDIAKRMAERLTQAALMAGARDNVTVIVMLLPGSQVPRGMGGGGM